jgi:hypothetical protein
MRMISLVFVITACLSAAAFAQTRPSGQGGLVRERFERFRTSLDSLNLTADQRAKANSLLTDTIEKLRDLGNEQDPTARQTKFRDAFQNLRESLSTVLTPDQLQEFRQKIQQGSPRAKYPTTAPATQPAGMMTMMQEETAEKSKPAVATTGPSAANPIEPGKAAPDFKLLKLDGGSPVQLSSFKGHVVCLIFGSYTCPTLRDRAMGLDRLYHDVEGKANVFLIYTREAHPVDGWDVERNKVENIQLQQPTSERARKSAARQAHDSLHLAMPILMDLMDDTVTEEYGGFPNAAVVIGANGVVFGTEQWAEPIALRHMIDEALAGPK